MREAVVVSGVHTPIGKAFRGPFNATQAQAPGARAIGRAIARAKLEGAEVDDVGGAGLFQIY